MEPTMAKRRSHFEAHIQRKLKWSRFVSGNVPNPARSGYVVLSRCSKPWRYWLFENLLDADDKKQELNLKGCGQGCEGKHSEWLEVMP
jgi:hypothetical protein